MIVSLFATFAFCAIVALVVGPAHAQEKPLLSGADISALPLIEKAGGVFRDGGRPGDEIKILRDAGCDLFRVRLFVRPDPEFRKTDGATQDLEYVRSLGKRIKSAGGQFLLDLHYADTWADPEHQTKPKDWEGLDFDALERRVADYTTETIKDLQDHDAAPDMVQVGNEITAGILWPDARLYHGPKEDEPRQWRKFTRLIAAGCRGVRAAERNGKKIPIVLHIHGGGRDGIPQSFFAQFVSHGGHDADFDVIGLSFYPAWNDDIDRLKTNMAELIAAHDKDILLAEVAYPWAPVTDIKGRETMRWPTTPQGQRQYLADVRQALVEAPKGRGLGYVWWYSDSVPVPDKTMHIWRDGCEALFDYDGNPLPALDMFRDKRR